ncbi:NYN domain-containing protein [Alkalibaculum sp. M08DMB]|uniref:NYN domain-containing protein n=1 Tax=Alkalibaculum sporogenes TaxID=2655001 RepID=A0A6A7K6P0_9FIRM|nr:NYN domain-containing protein [Alkalibaculum sporogenes]MPW25045.1 NYN domain-containing protein [Alkalibaculum sporogenes]
MRTYLIIDAYNIINQWATLKDIAAYSLEDARIKLISIVQSYSQIKNYYFIIVFDAYNINDTIKEENIDNGLIVYTQKNQTADSYIEKLVYDMPSVYEVHVATSDFTLQRMVLAHGAIRISASELEREVELALKTSLRNTEESYSLEKNYLEKFIDESTMNKLEKLRKGQG